MTTLFAAPPEKDLEWNDQGIEGASRFLNRVWRFVIAHLEEIKAAPDKVPAALSEPGRAFRRTIHETIQPHRGAPGLPWQALLPRQTSGVAPVPLTFATSPRPRHWFYPPCLHAIRIPKKMCRPPKAAASNWSL